ncbi:hypothetical protein FNY86_11565 [Corynebacterium guaraldiae]|uniref:hypothetical protein n=1 Tax=Corynebacterium guaraldiae TaxID=3051103 RepID=UPI00117842AE|nr:hypothetical protein [Corynebacterium guaraldiae]MCG7260551.1 hypothetical protein [Corynebacterium aurimucosum]TRX31869.1 hypothetical protein FNY86_11565 [Corynebacterium guaraldiae]TRX38384.1 hypothetical protein FNY89_10005 [Corynebacterium guaraldiae]
MRTSLSASCLTTRTHGGEEATVVPVLANSVHRLPSQHPLNSLGTIGPVTESIKGMPFVGCDFVAK